MRSLLPVASVALTLLLPQSPALAQECGCDHTIAVGATIVDGAELGFQPGDRVCVEAGEYEFLRFRRLAGTSAAPIEIINCGGLVRIHNDSRAYALVFEEGSHHFHITGTGDDARTYGFDVSAPAREPYPGVGVWFNGLSTNYEADHIEVHDTGFAGVMSKTDPLCDGSADQDVFTQRDVSLHHFYVHDTHGEGFYVGSTQANGHRLNCEGSETTRQPHFLRGISLTENVIERTGWDGAQVGMAIERCVVAGNTIRDVGRAGVEFQQQGLQIGSFSSCEVFANRLENGPTNGIFILEAGDTWVHDNLVVDFRGDGIYANVRDRSPGARYRFHFNTVVDTGEHAIQVFGGILGPSEARSNLAIAGEGIAAGGDVDWTSEANLVLDARSEAGFSGQTYVPAADSVARGAGVAVDMLDVDAEGYPRSAPPSVGAFEYRDPDVDAGPLDRDLTTTAGGTGGGGGSGGGCSTGPERETPWGVWLALSALLTFAVSRRTHREGRRVRH